MSRRACPAASRTPRFGWPGPAGGNHRDPAEHLRARYLTGAKWGPSNGSGRLGRSHYYAYRRLHQELWAWTLNTKGDSAYHYSAHRCLSVREFARLQSFPDRFHVATGPRRGPTPGRISGVTGAAHSRYRQIGNAVPPLLAAAGNRHDHRSSGDAMAGKFEVYEDRAGKFRFRLKASNGQVVATGEAYESKAAAKKGCESVLRAATGAPIEEVDS